QKEPAMWNLRCFLSFVAVLGMTSGLVAAQAPAKNTQSPAALLGLRPSMQGVEYDSPADEAATNACKVETVLDASNKKIGYALRDGQGKMLRRFVVSRGGKHMDQWSYYQDGFEVYREDDLDGDTHLDECRWLNSGGSRVAKIERGKIAAWKQISAEEASKVLIPALVMGDGSLLESVMATPL